MNMNLKGIMNTLGAKPGQVVSNPYVRAFAPQVEAIVKEEEDHEVSMAQNQLDSIIKAATELKAKIGEGEKDIPAWIQDHITNSENYISQASSNYHEYGTNEAVELPAAPIPASIKSKLMVAVDKIKDTNLTYNQKIQVVGQVMDSLGIDKAEFNKMASKLRGTMEGKVNEARLTDMVKSIVETPVIGKVIGSKLSEAKKYDVGAGYMGNGLTIWNRAEEEHGDYRIIAHIDSYGKISIRDKQIPSDVMKMIKDWAEAMKKGNK
jgi:hypothetical protein